MGKMNLDQMLSKLAALAILIVIALIVGIVMTGAGQDFFQVARSTEEMVNKVISNPAHALGLRINLGFDNFFIVLYASYFVLLAVRFSATVDSRMITVALSAILLTAFLDAVENGHIMMMIHSIQHGLPVSVTESQGQMVLSHVKFHSSYVALFLFAFGFWKEGGLGRAIASVFWLYALLGLVVMVMPTELARPLALGRTLFFIASFLLSAVFFRRCVLQKTAQYS